MPSKYFDIEDIQELKEQELSEHWPNECHLVENKVTTIAN